MSSLQAYDTIESFYVENRPLYRKLGPDFRTPVSYLRPFKKSLVWKKQKITFSQNVDQPIHRWAPYVEGFSFDFVKDTFDELGINSKMVVLDPFAGSGTLNIGAKMLNVSSIGIEKNPFMFFVMKTKLEWDIALSELERTYESLTFPSTSSIHLPGFLKVEKQFKDSVLENLLRIKEAIDKTRDLKIKALFRLVFASIIMECSNLKRSPSIGYDWSKDVDENAPFLLFQNRMEKVIEDLRFVQSLGVKAKTELFNEDSRTFLPNSSVDFVITSPPYLNAMDYIGNYKLEITWLDFAASTTDLRHLRDGLVVCDNVSRRFLKEYSRKPRFYSSDWLDYIEKKLAERMKQKPRPRRDDYQIVVRKYFEDLYQVIKNMYNCLVSRGQLVMVVGDSLICDVYVPTDLILINIARKTGFELNKLVVARHRRSGIRRSFKLRETIAYLKKKG